MRIAGEYSFNHGQETVQTKYPKLLREIKEVIALVDASECKTKENKEKTMSGKMLFSPTDLNNCFKKQFAEKGWESVRVACDYPTQYYAKDYQSKPLHKGAFRELDLMTQVMLFQTENCLPADYRDGKRG